MSYNSNQVVNLLMVLYRSPLFCFRFSSVLIFHISFVNSICFVPLLILSLYFQFISTIDSNSNFNSIGSSGSFSSFRGSPKRSNLVVLSNLLAGTAAAAANGIWYYITILLICGNPFNYLLTTNIIMYLCSLSSDEECGGWIDFPTVPPPSGNWIIPLFLIDSLFHNNLKQNAHLSFFLFFIYVYLYIISADTRGLSLLFSIAPPRTRS